MSAHTDNVLTCPLCLGVSIPLLLTVALVVYQRHKIWALQYLSRRVSQPLDPLKDRDVC